MGLTIEGLALDDPIQFYEQIGDPVADFGGTPVPAPRQALRHAVTIQTFTANAASDTVAQRLTVRRQLRSLANNSPYKLAGFYVAWTADPEQNGWYVPDMGQLMDGDGHSGLATGWWNLANVVWRKAGTRRTHRRAAQVTMLSYLTGLTPRDYLARVYSTDFSALTALAVTYLPPGAVDVLYSASGAAAVAVNRTTGSDGSAVLVVQGIANLATVSYEQPEASQMLGVVIAYDRLAAGGTTEANWQQVYGPDWPWYWPNTSASVPDTPVLENGYCRVRYDGTNTPGWRIDVWSSGAWVEQCKVVVARNNTGSINFETALQSSGLEEYTPERAVMKCVMTASGDATSREIVIITLQRGWSGPRFEVYPAPVSPGNPAGAYIAIQPAALDADDSAFAVAAGGATNISTALGTGHTGLFGAASIVGTLSDNAFAMLRSATAGSGGLALAYQINVAAVQAAAVPVVTPLTNAYGSNRNALVVEEPATTGYCSAQIGFSLARAHQIMEAENMTLGSGTSSSGDATASQALAASATRTSDANAHVTQATWPDGSAESSTYRFFARVRVTAGTGHVYAKTDNGTGGTGATGSTVTTTSTSYVWLDLGSLVNQSGTLEIHAWTSSGTIYVDRIEAYLLQDRNGTLTSAYGQYQGAQDIGQSALYESWVANAIVSRA